MKFYLGAFLACSLLLTGIAKADPNTQVATMNAAAIDSSTKTGMNTVEQMRLGHLRESWLQGFEGMIQFALAALKEKGQHELAQQILSDWTFYQQRLSGHSIVPLDLGDHRPVHKWLEWVYQALENTLGKTFCEFFYLTDIRAFNYGYIVTFNPNGDPITNESWDQIEYQKHFVPFATAAFYWAAYTACSVMAPFPASIGCSIALRAPRYVVKRWVAPPASNEVYIQAKKKKNSKG